MSNKSEFAKTETANLPFDIAALCLTLNVMMLCLTNINTVTLADPITFSILPRSTIKPGVFT
jgi:hypothetical protein